MPALSRVRHESGFTLVEVMVTMLLLVVGISGAIALIDGANARTLMTKEREAANGLSREVIEAARSVPYQQLNPTSARGALEAIPGLADSTPSTLAWTVQRRKQTYTIALSVCSIDDSQDSFGDKAGGNFCSTAGTGTDLNPDDYKRVTVTVTWKRRSVTRTIRHAGIVNNEASATGPAVEFTGQDPAGDLITVQTSPIKFDVQAAPTAVAIRFAVDGALIDTANSSSATFAWDVDSGGDHVPDGTYVVSVTAFDAEGIPGPTRARTIRLNRDAPAPPQNVFGGWNPRGGLAGATDIVELQWARNTEPDVTGYRVYRVSSAGTEVVPGCDFPAKTDVTECHDLNPPADATVNYYVVAVDENPFTGGSREGQPSTAVTAVRATTRPEAPPALTVTNDDGDVLLTWSPSAPAVPAYSGSDVIFYRVYRDGTALGDRIGRTSQDSLTSFRDLDAAAGSHVYYVTAVDQNFSESAPLGPVAVP